MSSAVLPQDPRRIFRTRGFTLVEVMIVVVVMGIVMGIAAPSIMDYIRLQRIGAAASAVHETLIFARSEAIKRNATATVSRTGATWAEGWTVTAPVAGVPTTLHTQNALVDMVVTVYVPSTATALSSIGYLSSGRLDVASSNAQVMVYLSAEPLGTARCVLMNLNGMPAIKADTTTSRTDAC